MVISKSDLREKINNHFDLQEFRSLCFDLGNFDVRFDDLAGETLRSKIESLIGFLERRGQLPVLVTTCVQLRPNVNWYEMTATLEDWRVGKWVGQWYWRNKLRVAEIDIAATPDRESRIRITYTKIDSITVVEQSLSIVVGDDVVELTGIGYRFIEQGHAVGYHLDRFMLRPSNDRKKIFGVKVDKRGVEVPVEFHKLSSQITNP